MSASASVERARAPPVEVVGGQRAARTRPGRRARGRSRITASGSTCTSTWPRHETFGRHRRDEVDEPDDGDRERGDRGTSSRWRERPESAAGAGGGRAASAAVSRRARVRSGQSLTTSQTPSIRSRERGTRLEAAPSATTTAAPSEHERRRGATRGSAARRRTRANRAGGVRFSAFLDQPLTQTSPTRCRSHSRQAICPTLEPSHGTPRASSVTSRNCGTEKPPPSGTRYPCKTRPVERSPGWVRCRIPRHRRNVGS